MGNCKADRALTDLASSAGFQQPVNDYVGQLAAISDYNSGSVGKKLAPIAGLVHSRRVPAPWNDKIYVHHGFEHRDYNTYIHEDADRQLHI